MRILVAGARSALGSRAARLLTAQGHEVVGLTRGPAGNEMVSADVLDAAATRAAVRDVAPDAIVQTLNALPKHGPASVEELKATAALRIDGTRNLLAAAEAAGVRRYVAENFCFVYGLTPVGAPAVTEDHPLAGTAETVSEDEQVRALGGVVLRCAFFYGDVGSTHARAERIRAGTEVVPRDAPYAVSWLHIDDAATAVVAALEHGSAGTAYNIAAEEAAGQHAMSIALARRLGVPAPRELSDAEMAATLPEYVAGTLRANLVISAARARAELGWTPAYPTIAEGLASTAF